MKTLTLRKGKEEALARRHPWIFSGAIYRPKQKLEEGEAVWVENVHGDIKATGHYHDASIAIRVLAFDKKEINLEFYTQSIQAALNRRSMLNLDSNITNAYRLVAGEGDSLSGLIIDNYNGHVVIQCHSAGMYQDIEMIRQACIDVLSDSLKSIFLKEIHIKNTHYDARVLFGEAKSATILENGLKFNVDWVHGQKTGFFLDQRENRKLLQRYSEGKKVLNTFCYTGGFSVYALAGGAEKVHSIDISKTAMEETDRNIILNFPEIGAQHKSIVGDVLRHLTELDEDQYNLIVLDPPAFAKSKKKSHNALQAYKRLNALAIQKIQSGGIIFSFSCSQVINRSTFEHTIRAASIETGRDIQIIHHLTQGPDHMVNVYHTEGHYLKGLVYIVQ